MKSTSGIFDTAHIGISINEVTTIDDIEQIVDVIAEACSQTSKF